MAFLWLFNLHNPAKERDVGLFELVWRTIVTAIGVPLNRLFNPNSPHFVPGAVEFIEQHLEELKEQDVSVFEFGSGQSSIWWAKRKRVSKYIGVEHNEIWYDKVIQDIADEELEETVEVIYQPTVDFNGRAIDWREEWEYYHILEHPPSKPKFKEYIATIDKYPDNHFDIIVIDGRERVGSVLHAIPKLKQNGLLIFDDSSRPRYREAIQLLDSWDCYLFDMGLHQTSIFTRK